MIAIVTGASSGIGYETARLLAQKGFKVYGLSRRGTVPENCIGVKADVSDENAVLEAVRRIAEAEGTLDLLVNNAGMGISGPVEFTGREEARRIMDVNFFGQFYAAKAVIPYMRRQKSGSIVFLSSVAAPIAIPYQAFYSASKSAVSSLALALRNELKDFGIRVCAVLPGDAKTGFTDARRKAPEGSEIYTHCEEAVRSMEKDERNGMTSSSVAKKVVLAATARNPRPLYTVGAKYRVFTALFKFLPARLSYWIVGKMY